jgi:hypothetical protein
MGRSFSTSDAHGDFHLKPLRVASLKDGVWQEAKDLAEVLPNWTVLSCDDERMVLTCERRGGALAGRSLVTIAVEGPDGIPSTTVHVRSESEGGLPGFARDRAVVLEFMRPFHRRVC